MYTNSEVRSAAPLVMQALGAAMPTGEHDALEKEVRRLKRVVAQLKADKRALSEAVARKF